jgi:arylsulfatase A-like enzyme/Flp pilus assembly protein TadD
MPMKRPRKWLLAAAAAAMIFPLSLRGKDTNVLLVTIDTLRPDRLSCYSPKHLQTPRIDALAASGVLFERAFAHVPLTLPSHTSILLGLLPPKHGISENSKSIVPDRFPTLATVLKADGYSTGAFVGAFALDSGRGLTSGFDVYDDRYPRKLIPGALYPERPAEKVIGPALDWLAKQSGKWFLWVHLWDPHAPYSPPEPFASRFKNEPYAGEVAYVDAELGKLIDAVEKMGGIGKTLIILTGDHGESLGEHGESEHGYFAYNSTIWVPLIIAGPEINPARVKEFVSHVDIFPTVCEALGLEKPPDLAGASLAPLLKGRARKSPPIYFEALDAHLNRGWAPLRGVIRDGKKYIDLPIPELYDLEKDFAERSNMAPGADLSSPKKSLGEIMARDYSPDSAGAGQMPSRETREKLRSLGYVATPMTPVKKSYGPEDDLKTLCPLNQNLSAAAGLSKAGKTAESIRLLEDTIRARKDFSQAYDGLYRVYIAQGLVEEALASLDRGYVANPKNYFLVAAYGVTLANSGRWEKSIEVLTQAVSLYDRDAEVWDSLGLAYWKTGDYVKAKAHFEEALALSPSDPVYNNHMGSFYVAAGLKLKSMNDVVQAEGYFNTAIAADPELAAAYNGRAGAFRIMGRIDEAIADWNKAVELDPAYDLPVYNLAVIYLETGDKTRALEFCQKYLLIKGKWISEQERKDIESLIQQCKK